MSIKTPSDVNPDTTVSALSKRMVANTHDALDRIASRYETMTAKTHASIAYDDAFWRDLQTTLINYTAERRALLSAGGYTDQASDLQHIELFTIRTAVEEFRSSCKDDPYSIHDATAWETFRNNLHSTGSEYNTVSTEPPRS